MQWHFDAANHRDIVERNYRISLAYHIAWLNNARRAPSLNSLMLDPDTGRSLARRQTPEQQIAIARRLNALFGGTVERRPSPE